MPVSSLTDHIRRQVQEFLEKIVPESDQAIFEITLNQDYCDEEDCDEPSHLFVDLYLSVVASEIHFPDDDPCDAKARRLATISRITASGAMDPDFLKQVVETSWSELTFYRQTQNLQDIDVNLA